MAKPEFRTTIGRMKKKSNEPTKTKKAMKTMKNFLSMAALAMVGAMTVGCTSEDNVIDQAQTATKNNVVTQTVTVGFDEQAATRALAIDYGAKTLTKTFKADDQIAVIYQNTSNELVKETVTIAAGDISTDGKSATFTVTMTDPKDGGTLKYIYPAAMAGATDVDYSKLNSQDGKLTSLASNLDLAVYDGTLTAEKALPASATLENKLAILALTIKNSGGTELTGITGMNIIAGTNSYSITGKDTDGHIYAAIQPTSGANISYFATDGTKNYTKAVTGKTYVADNIYNLGLKMTDASVVSLAGVSEGDPINVSNGQTITGTLTDEDEYLISANITIEDGAIVTLKDVGINPYGDVSGSGSGITCAGNATIILEGTNTVKGFGRSGIEVKSGYTLTILGTGTLNASGYNTFSGIGGEGNIVINGGNITATGGSDGGAGIGGGNHASCGNITISGGTVTATGGNKAAGIGSGFEGFCGNITISGGIVEATGGSDSDQYHGAGIGSGAYCSIDNTISITITSGVTSVTATRGSDGGGCKFIGAGSVCSNGATVTIDGVADATTSSDFPNFNSSVSGNTWTLTHK